jgi:hypothetical protein
MNILFSSIVGTVNPPPGVDRYGNAGLGKFIGNLFRLIVIFASLYALFNFIMAGYSFLSAGGDPKKIEASWAKIWQSILGLAITAGGFTIGAMVSQIFFGDPTYIFTLNIVGAP